jgi:uncharacterized membrane protein YdbT with pleckstrin-like domain
MSYILSNLKDNEKLAFKSSQSIKSLFFWSFIFGFIGLALVLLKGFVIIMGVSLYLIYWSVLLFFVIKNLITYFTTEYGITNTRVISKQGLIRRDIEEINLSSIESINVNQSIIGRILNYGTIIVSGRGTSKVIFKDIDNVVEVRKLIKNT